VLKQNVHMLHTQVLFELYGLISHLTYDRFLSDVVFLDVCCTGCKKLETFR